MQIDSMNLNELVSHSHREIAELLSGYYVQMNEKKRCEML